MLEVCLYGLLGLFLPVFIVFFFQIFGRVFSNIAHIFKWDERTQELWWLAGPILMLFGALTGVLLSLHFVVK